MLPKAEDVAKEFCRLMKKELTDEDFSKVVSLNKYEEREWICHSHDFLDSNMVMDEALENLGSPWPELDMEEAKRDAIVSDRTYIWNRAWYLAVSNEFNM